ncbi:unnamed protein product [Paramecium pentaurelia]|uniref:Uncharacterized protein n=1 Tax=Paramecium pentaurelia TaxID=43138 RepID=A0A8S1SRA1_9CILI|nr:unnamed protein product [Paramecium pentaurelia]
MELKGAFSYLIQILSNYILDNSILLKLTQLRSLLDNKQTKELEIKKFIVSIGQISLLSNQSKETKNSDNQILISKQKYLSKQQSRFLSLINILQPLNQNQSPINSKIQRQTNTHRSLSNNSNDVHKLNDRLITQITDRVKNQKRQFNIPNVFIKTYEDYSSNNSPIQSPINIYNSISNFGSIKNIKLELQKTSIFQIKTTLIDKLKYTIQDFNNNTIEILSQTQNNQQRVKDKFNRKEINPLFKNHRKSSVDGIILF